MQPGKPQGFGHLGDKVPIFCLPGNPVSSLVSFEAFVRPAIRKLLGKRSLQRATVQAVALEGAKSPHGVRQYRRGVLHREASGGYSVSFVGGPGSHLHRLAGAVELPGRHRRGGHRGRRRLARSRSCRCCCPTGDARRWLSTPGWPAEPRPDRSLLRPPRLRDARRLERDPAAQRAVAGAVGADLAAQLGRAQRGAAWPPLHSALRRPARRGTMLPFMIFYGGRLVGQLNVVQHRARRAALVHGRLLGRRRGGRARHHPDRAGAGRSTTASARSACTASRSTSARRTRPACASSRSSGCAARASTSASSTSTAAWRDHVAFAVTVEELGGHSMLPGCRAAARADLAHPALTVRRVSQPQVEVPADTPSHVPESGASRH